MPVSVGPRGADDLFDQTAEVPLYRDPLILREQVLLQLRKVVDPDLHRDIVSCNFIKGLKFDYDSGRVEFILELTTPACPVKDQFVDQCTSLLNELDWVQSVHVTVSSSTSAATKFAGDSAKNLKEVGFILAVSSCKGGVGKSSLAVNIAFMLKNLGARVGIVDVDIYGPSLHTLIPIDKPQVLYRPPDADQADSEAIKMSLSKGEGSLMPCEYDGVKLMSYSFFRPEASAYAAVRGPLASSIAYQLVTQTEWGSLDYLVIDMPPGTGDVHLTIAQSVKITGAVVVSTPQKLSLIDVEKGIHFFHKLNVPTVAIIENMAYLSCPHCGEQVELFQSVMDITHQSPPASQNPHTCPSSPQPIGAAAMLELPPSKALTPLESLVETFGIGVHRRLPLDPHLSAVRFRDFITGEFKFPFATTFDEKHSLWRELKSICQAIARELSRMAFGGNQAPDVSSTSDGYLQMVYGSGDVHQVSMRAVRLACRCAECLNEVTGKTKINARWSGNS